MKLKSVKDWLSDAVPVERKSAADWIVPACVGLGIGVALGMGAGLLLAPQTGEQAREKLRDRANELRHRAIGTAERARAQIEHKASEVRSQVERATST
jgi:gas vesicle protein